MISVIIVHYHVKKELFACIKSIIASSPKTSYEIIVVDNDEQKNIERDLKKTFPKVIYIPNKNKGYGQGNNVGSQYAKGDYLFFLNPDTTVYKNALDTLVTYLKSNKSVGIAAPMLMDSKNKPFLLQGVKTLNPSRAIWALSLVNKILPNNKVYNDYYLTNWDKESIKKVEVVPGTAFMISKKLFEKIGKFDDKFFLYFEEFDLCKRLIEKGFSLVILPQSKIMHHWGSSTKKSSKNIQLIFQQSRFYYFKKHFGLLKALAVESILRVNKYILILGGIIAGGSWLLTYRLNELMPFIGDHGWFYLSAKDMLLTGTIPLVGITSSHPWLHQGAFWTYLLAGAFSVSNFHPLSGAYLGVLLGVLTILLVYFVGSNMFSRRVGLIASLLYATSPLVIMHVRMPYHTLPIPIFTLVFLYAMYKWVKGNNKFLPLVIFSLAVLYNFQISTYVLTVVLIMVMAYGVWKRKKWLVDSFNPKILLLSVLSFVIPMLPMLIYDFTHGFPQTLMVVAWIGYKILTVFGYPSLRPDLQPVTYSQVFVFLSEAYKKLIYIPSSLVAFTLFIFSFGFLIQSIKEQLRTKNINPGILLLGLTSSISILGILATRTISEAYLPVLFPLIIFITALFLDKLVTLRPKLTFMIVLIIGTIVIHNSYTLIENNYFIGSGTGYKDKLAAAKQVISEADERKYNLIGKGQSSQFESFTNQYEYLTWWLGNGPSKTQQDLQIFIEEKPEGIVITKKDKND